MKNKLLTILVFNLFCLSCEDKPKATIEFCQSLGQKQICVGENHEFPLSEVFVRCEIAVGLESGTIIGKLYGLDGDQRIPFGNKIFELAPGERVVAQSIPFHEFGPEGIGNFLVEFVNDRDEVLAQKELIIKAASSQ